MRLFTQTLIRRVILKSGRKAIDRERWKIVSLLVMFMFRFSIIPDYGTDIGGSESDGGSIGVAVLVRDWTAERSWFRIAIVGLL